MYTLQAIIAKAGTLNSSRLEGAQIVPMQQGYEMLPLTDALLEQHEIIFLPLTDEGLADLPDNIKSACEILSVKNKLAYIEAEYFGGAGTQACAVFSNGKMVAAPTISESAINQALKTLGVTKNSNFDEFEAVGLNAERDTNKWVK